MGAEKVLLRLPPKLAEKVAHEAEERDLLVTEYLRMIVRDAVGASRE